MLMRKRARERRSRPKISSIRSAIVTGLVDSLCSFNAGLARVRSRGAAPSLSLTSMSLAAGPFHDLRRCVFMSHGRHFLRPHVHLAKLVVDGDGTYAHENTDERGKSERFQNAVHLGSLLSQTRGRLAQPHVGSHPGRARVWPRAALGPLVLGEIAWSLGEFAGYARGAGTACEELW